MDLQVFCCLGLLLAAVFEETNCSDFIRLTINEWETNYFSKYGTPVFTKELEQYCNLKNSTFHPNFSVIPSDMTTNNKYILLDEMNDVVFRFYGQSFPNRSNYMINVTSLETKIERCKITEDACVQIRCKRDNITTDKEPSENGVYIWWTIQNRILKLVVQHQKKFITCTVGLEWEIEKLVMQGSKDQKIRYTTHEFKTTEQEGHWLFTPTFDLDPGKSIYIQSMQCWLCQTHFSLECDDFRGCKVSIEGNSTKGSNKLYGESDCPNTGWKDIILPVERQEGLRNCQLYIDTINTGGNISVPFWTILTSVANVNISTANNWLKDLTTTTTTTTSTTISTTNVPEVTTCPSTTTAYSETEDERKRSEIGKTDNQTCSCNYTPYVSAIVSVLATALVMILLPFDVRKKIRDWYNDRRTPRDESRGGQELDPMNSSQD